MLERPIVVLSSWCSGSPLVAGFLGQCGVYLCPPFAKSLSPGSPSTYESEMYRGLVSATINEFSFEQKVDTSIFRHGFKSWYRQQVEVATKVESQRIVLNHPLSVFLLEEICQVVDPIFIVVTRSFGKIEQTRLKQNLEPSYGSHGARIIYERAYTFLHQFEKNYLAISFRNFAANKETRLTIVDYCDLDVSSDQVEAGFNIIFQEFRRN